MKGLSPKGLLLSFLLLLSFCVSVRAETEISVALHGRDDDGGNAKRQDDTIPEEDQTLKNHETKHNIDSEELQKDGSSVRSETTNTTTVVLSYGITQCT